MDLLLQAQFVKSVVSSGVYIALDELLAGNFEKTGVLINGKDLNNEELAGLSLEGTSTVIVINLVSTYVVDPFVIKILEKVSDRFKFKDPSITGEIEMALVTTISSSLILLLMKYQISLGELIKLFGSNFMGEYLTPYILKMIITENAKRVSNTLNK